MWKADVQLYNSRITLTTLEPKLNNIREKNQPFYAPDGSIQQYFLDTLASPLPEKSNLNMSKPLYLTISL